MGDEEFDQISRVIRYPGWGFWLNLLDRILVLEDEAQSKKGLEESD